MYDICRLQTADHRLQTADCRLIQNALPVIRRVPVGSVRFRLFGISLNTAKGRTIRKLMGGGGGEVQKKLFAKGKIK